MSWARNQFGENELERILFLGIPESTANYEALRRGATKAIKNLMLELIGEDDVTNGAFADINEKAEHYNELRAELRHKVKEL